MTNEIFSKKINPFRNKIDSIDFKIISLLAERQKQVLAIASLKKKYVAPICHLEREKSLIANLRHQAHEKGVDLNFVEDLYHIIIDHSKQIQKYN